MINFEITNQCNLRCPSCHAGRATHFSKNEPFRYASLETCEKVFSKIVSFKQQHVDLRLYKHSEPLLHPYIDVVLDLADKYNLNCSISSNLNVKKDWAKLLSHSSLKEFIISVSGYTQEVYERGHRGGRIDLVLKHLKEISIVNKDIKKKIDIRFLQYTDNSQDEKEFETFCRLYNFNLLPDPAYFWSTPWDMEKHLQGGYTPKNLVNLEKPWLKDGIKNVFPRTLYAKDIFYAKVQGLERCSCRSELRGDINIDIDGNVHHGCCLALLTKDNVYKSIFNMSFEETMQLYTSLQLCRDCKSKGYHVQLGLIPHVEYSSFMAGYDTTEDKPSINEKIRYALQAKEPFPALEGKKIYVYGLVGGEGVLDVLQLCKHEVTGIIEDNPSFAGMTTQDFQVTPLKELSKHALDGSVVIICFVVRSNEALKKLKEKIVQCGASEIYTVYEFFNLVEIKHE